MTAPATAPSSLAEAVSEAAERFSTENPESRARFERATQYLPGGDTRTVNYYAPFPVTIVRGEGARLQDLDGHVYLDFLGDYTAGLYGPLPPRHPGGAGRSGRSGFDARPEPGST